MENKSLNEKESLELIARMIQNTHNNLENKGYIGLLVNGYCTLFTSLLVYFLVRHTHNNYYFIATLITIIQTWVIQRYVNDEKLLRQIELAKSKPTKKSKFQERLEQMQRMQEQRTKEQQQKKKKN